jgi:Ni,Fe-hydrogenase maturation factor
VLPSLDAGLRGLLEVRRCEQLDPIDLIDVTVGEACLIIDTVVGVEPGEVVEIGLESLATQPTLAPRSSHALPIGQVLGIARSVRGSLPRGTFVGIGGKWFGFGELRSRAVRDGMGRFEQTIAAALAALATPHEVGR